MLWAFKKMTLLFVLLSFILLSPEASSQNTKNHKEERPPILWTTHPQVAFDLKNILHLYKLSPSLNIQQVFPLTSDQDIHNYSPTPSSLKTLIGSSPLVLGPLSLQRLPPLSGLSQLLPKNHLLLKSDPHGDVREDHYWLLPQRALSFEEDLIQFLNKQGFSLKNQKLWSNALFHQTNRIRKELKRLGIKRIVLSHNALEYFFSRECKRETLVFYTNDHHREILAKNLKRIYKWAKNPREILFIYERGIPWPLPLKGEAFQNVPRINWAAIGPFPLKELADQLEEIPL